MRRYLIILMMPCFVMLFGICCLAGCEGSRHYLKKVRLNEVAHSIFYAPTSLLTHLIHSSTQQNLHHSAFANPLSVKPQ